MKAVLHIAGCIAGGAFAIQLWGAILLDGGSTARRDATHTHLHESKGGYSYTTDRQEWVRDATNYVLYPAVAILALFGGLYLRQKAREEQRVVRQVLGGTDMQNQTDSRSGPPVS